jgi:hypothetical protein
MVMRTVLEKRWEDGEGGSGGEETAEYGEE